MKKTLHVKILFFTLALGLLAVLRADAQMKIGNHPTSIQPASILELESNNQALRLTQGDTALVNAIIATEVSQNGKTGYQLAEGMIMYQNTDSTFYMRMQGSWHKVMSADAVNNEYFKLGGNTITTTNAFLGLKGASDSLSIGTDSSSASIIVMPNGTIHMLDSLVGVLAKVDSLYSGMASIDTLTVNDSLNVAGSKFIVNSDSSQVFNVFVMQDSVIMKNLANAYGADTSLLSISPDGIVHKMSIDSLLSVNKPTINGINSNVFYLKMGSDSTGHRGPWIDSTSQANTLVFNIPVASDTIQGLVDTLAQTFKGDKSFMNSMTVGSAETPGATLDVHGNVNMKTIFINTGTNYDLSTTGDTARTIIIDVTTVSGEFTVQLPSITTTLNGRIYTIKKVGDPNDGQIDKDLKISPAGGQTFADGGSSYIIYNNFTSVTVQAMNSKWHIIGH